MTKRKVIPKKVRIEVYNKYKGHCAYCGKATSYSLMKICALAVGLLRIFIQ